MDVAYINPFLSAVSHLFATMIKLPLHVSPPSVRGGAAPIPRSFRYSAVVELSGARRGLVIISFSQPVARALATALAGQPFTAKHSDLVDAIGEIANMIVGGARPHLPDAGRLRVSLPLVQNASDVAFPLDAKVITIPFDTGAGRFLVESSLH